MKYEVLNRETPLGDIHVNIQRTDDDGTVWVIPVDESNSDYQAYLAWVAEQEENN